MNLEWMVIRGSGIVAFALLAASSIWGLLISTNLLGRTVKAKPVTWFHESLGLGALIATAVHMVALTMDDYIEFGWVDVLVPGAASWRPLAVAFGTMAFYGLAVVGLSFYVKPLLGRRAWRVLHFFAFGTFAAALVHGIAAGTDTGHPGVAGLYTGAGVLIAALVTLRFIRQRSSGDGRSERRRPRVDDATGGDHRRVPAGVGD